MCKAWIKSVLIWWFFTLVFTRVPLLTLWSMLVGMLFPLWLALWEVSSLMPQKIKLSCLRVTGNCFDVSSGWLWRFHYLANCLTLLVGNFSRSILESFMVLETNYSSFRKKSEYISMQDACSFWWDLAREPWAWTALYHSSTDLFPCLKLVSRSNLALTSFVCGLQKSSYLGQITSKLKSSLGKQHDT